MVSATSEKPSRRASDDEETDGGETAVSSSANIKKNLPQQQQQLRQRQPPQRAAAAQQQQNNQNGESNKSKKSNSSPSRQDRILRQRRAQQQLSRKQHDALAQIHEQSLSRMQGQYLKTLAMVLVVGGIVLTTLAFLYPPKILWKLLGWNRPPESLRKWPKRQIMTLYPPQLHIQRDLPRFFHNYAVATEQNVEARHAVKHSAALRRGVTDSGLYRKQPIFLNAWEHDEFRQQVLLLDAQRSPYEALVNNRMDQICGQGFVGAHQYLWTQLERQQLQEATGDSTYHLQRRLLDDLVFACLMVVGQYDGFVRFATTVERSLTRGLDGVVAKYVDSDDDAKQNRICSDLLWLPLVDTTLETDNAKRRRQPRIASQVPRQWMDWLLKQTSLTKYSDEAAYVAAMECFLYTAIVEEEQESKSKDNHTGTWQWMEAACLPEGRARLDAQHLRLATNCPSDDGNESDPTCCSIYDPHKRPSTRRRVAQDDDDDD